MMRRHVVSCISLNLNLMGGRLVKQEYNVIIIWSTSSLCFRSSFRFKRLPTYCNLMFYFVRSRKRGAFLNLVTSEENNQDPDLWSSEENRTLLRAMTMTVCDLAAISKPWPVEERVASLVTREFFQQGDIERHELKITPIVCFIHISTMYYLLSLSLSLSPMIIFIIIDMEINHLISCSHQF